MIYFLFIFIGFGVFATKSFKKGEFLLQYAGDVVTEERAQKLEIKYTKANKGSYMYFFKHAGKELW